MRITYYNYNTFVIQWYDKKIAIDPGGLFAYWFSFASLIPKEEYKGLTHIFVTHGDPDHYWHVDRVMKASGAPIILNKNMVKECNGNAFMLGPRSKGLTFDMPVSEYYTLAVNDTIEVDGVHIQGIRTTHGPLNLKFGPIRKSERPGPMERVGWGSIGFQMGYRSKSIVNLGDTLLHDSEWRLLKNVNVLMLPIGGRKMGNTMNEDEALAAVEIIKPELVIPTHYNCPVLFSKKYNPADSAGFQSKV